MAGLDRLPHTLLVWSEDGCFVDSRHFWCVTAHTNASLSFSSFWPKGLRVKVFFLHFFLSQSPVLRSSWIQTKSCFFGSSVWYDMLSLGGICQDAGDNPLSKCCWAGLFCSKSGFAAGGWIQGEKQNYSVEDGSRWLWRGGRGGGRGWGWGWVGGLVGKRPQADTKETWAGAQECKCCGIHSFASLFLLACRQ